MSIDDALGPSDLNAEDQAQSVDWLRGAIQGLSVADKSRLWIFARQQVRGTIYEPGDLVNESIARALGRARTCPLDVDIVSFLLGVIKSVGFDWRKRRHSPLHDPETDVTSEARRVDARGELLKLLKMFDDDDQQFINLHFVQGYDAKEVRSQLKMTKKAYDSKLKRIRRRIDQHFGRHLSKRRRP